MEIMNPYQELFGLYYYDKSEWFKLSMMTLFHHLILFYLLSVLSLHIHPGLLVLGGIYGEFFLSLFLTQHLHFVWLRRNIQNDS